MDIDLEKRFVRFDNLAVRRDQLCAAHVKRSSSPSRHVEAIELWVADAPDEPCISIDRTEHGGDPDRLWKSIKEQKILPLNVFGGDWAFAAERIDRIDFLQAKVSKPEKATVRLRIGGVLRDFAIDEESINHFFNRLSDKSAG